MQIPTTIRLGHRSDLFYHTAVFLYLLHMAVMANLTSFYPDALLRFRMPSFLLVSVLACLAIGWRLTHREFPLRAAGVYCALIAALLLGTLYHEDNFIYIKDVLFSGYFIKYVLLFSLLFLFEDAPDLRVRQLTVIATASLLVYQIGISQGMFLLSNDYMTIGYGCAPWWVIVTQGVFYYRSRLAKLFCAGVSLYFAAVIATYGNRGALLLILLALLILLLVYLPLNQMVFLGSAAVAALAAGAVFMKPLFRFMESHLGMDLSGSRNFYLLSEGRLTYDSGRFPIYRDCLVAIFRHPLLGNGACGDQVITTRHDYAHNIVLELCVEYGVIAGLLIYAFLVYIGFRMLFRCRDRAWRALFLPFYTFSMIELFFSGTLYESGYLLSAVIIYCVYSSRSRQEGVPRKETDLESQTHLSIPV